MPLATLPTSIRPESCCDKYSCTIAMLLTRLMQSRSTKRVSPHCARRSCKRKRLAIVCKLFLTRWWISLITTDLIKSSSSFLRSSVISCKITMAQPPLGRGTTGSTRMESSKSCILNSLLSAVPVSITMPTKGQLIATSLVRQPISWGISITSNICLARLLAATISLLGSTTMMPSEGSIRW